jgi:hypothetical protein
MRIQLVNVAKMPKKRIMIVPGTMPTTAKLDGSESIPLLTISAIINTATICHDRVR